MHGGDTSGETNLIEQIRSFARRLFRWEDGDPSDSWSLSGTERIPVYSVSSRLESHVEEGLGSLRGTLI